MIVRIFGIILPVLLISLSECYSQVNQEWIQRYQNSGSSADIVKGIVTDYSGNVFVTGTLESNTITDFVTVKYSQGGTELWVRIFDGGLEDKVIDMDKDNSGNIFVTGLSENQTGTYDIITIKYNPDGDSVWVRRYNGAYVFSMDQPTAIKVADENNIYVSGYTFGGGATGLVTIKYNSNGDSVWVARAPEGSSGISGDIFADESGNVYVYKCIGSGFIIKYSSDGTRQWLKNYPMEFSRSAKSISADNSGNMYFMGMKGTQTSNDYSVLKITPDGDTLWMRIYNCLGSGLPGNDEPKALCSDNSGNVYITGETYFQAKYYFSTMKINADGTSGWIKTFRDTSGTEGGADIINDNSGNVYVTGGNSDYITVKYSSSGDSMWSQTYNGTFGFNDLGTALTADINGNIYVTGSSRSPGGSLNYDFVTIKYSQTLTGFFSGEENLTGFKLFQNYPNPFNPTTNISFSLSNTEYVTLKIYDVTGREIHELVNGISNAGNHQVEFDGSVYSGGIYFYRLKAGNYSETKKMILSK